jgi:hypothetical protein
MLRIVMTGEVADLALEVNSVLREYLSIQNRIFKFSLKKALGLFRPDPLEASEAVVPLLDRLEKVRVGIKGLSPSDESEEGRFLMVLRAYSRAMSEAMESFRDLCVKLERHKKDRRYRRGPYLEDMKSFQEMETRYLEIGLKLNELKKSISEESEK